MNRSARPRLDLYSVHDATIEFRHNFPPEFHAIHRPSAGQQPVWDALLKALGAWWKQRGGGAPSPRPRGVLLLGKSQRGKTALASMLAHFGAATAGLRPGYVNCETAKLDLSGSFARRDENTERLIALADPMSYPVCLIDDLGAQAGHPQAESLVNSLVYMRSQAPCFTLVTANYAWDELCKVLKDPRVLTRLHSDAGMVRVEMPDLPRYQPEALNREAL